MADRAVEDQFFLHWVGKHGHPPTREQGDLFQRELEEWQVQHLVDYPSCVEACVAEMQKTGLSVPEHAAKFPGQHVWMQARGIVSCCICILCRRNGGGSRTPCKGPVRIELRCAESPAPG